MIIRSQNKTRIMDDLNLHIGIHEYKATDNTYEIRDTSNVAIGEYSTMEKAVRVLDMICDACRNIAFIDEQAVVFNMPQDSEV